ncbi:MAG: hypothetical protein S4CHLAM102_01720 [Chlamydiia bacterium]|nr:hypothetical protein [Chlamydiia bacterium]
MSFSGFIAAGLESLDLSKKPETHFDNLMESFEQFMPKPFLHQVKVIRRYIDIINIRSFLKNEPIDHRGNLSAEELEIELANGELLPDYVIEYFEENQTKDQQIRNFPGLISRYFSNEMSEAKGVLREYLQFERELRLLIAVVLAKRLGMNVREQLQFEDTSDPFVTFLLAQADRQRIDFPFGFEELQGAFDENVGADERLRMINAFRYNRFNAVHVSEQLSQETILVHLIQLMILEDYYALDAHAGQSVIDSIGKEEK